MSRKTVLEEPFSHFTTSVWWLGEKVGAFSELTPIRDMHFIAVWGAHEITMCSVEVFHVNWKNNSALRFQLLLSSSFKAEFHKGLCLVSNEWDRSSLLLLQTLSSFPNNLCEAKCAWAVEMAAVYATLWLYLEFSGKCAVHRNQTELRLSNMPTKREDNRRNPCPLCLCCPWDTHVWNPTGTKPKALTSKCFPFMKYFLLYVLTTPVLYLYTTKTPWWMIFIRKKFLTVLDHPFLILVYFKLGILKLNCFRILKKH